MVSIDKCDLEQGRGSAHGLGTACRLGYMDVAKGIAILAVITAHFYAPGIWGRVIYSFHMPLFFIISGYFVKDYTIEKQFFRSCKRLLIPYAIGTLLEMMAELWMVGFGQKGIARLKVLFLDMIGGMCKNAPLFPRFHGTWVLWFLPCLFLARSFYIVIMNLTEHVSHALAKRLVLFVFLAFIGKRLCITNIYYPWGMEIAFVVLPFLFLGDMFYRCKVLENKYRYVAACICFALWMIFLCNNLYLELARHYWPYFYLVLFESMIASFFVICFSQILDKAPCLNVALRWIGKNSLIILLIHNVDMRYGRWDQCIDPKYLDNGWIILALHIGFALGVTALIRFLAYLWKEKCLGKTGS